MVSLQNSPTLHRTFCHNSFSLKHATFASSRREGISFIVKASQLPSDSSSASLSQDRPGRRQVIAIGAATAPSVFLFNQHSYSFAAENKKGFLTRKMAIHLSILLGGSGQEVVIDGQDKIFKDVIEPLENVSVTMIPTGKQDIQEFGSPQQVAEMLIKKGFGPSNAENKDN